MNNEIKENILTFDDTVLLNKGKNWQFLANTDYNINTQTMALISKILNQLLAEQDKNEKLVEALEEISGCTQHKSDFCNHQSDCSFCRMRQAQQALNEVNK